MKYNGVKIKGFRVTDESQGGKEVVCITDCHIESTNGYKVEVLPMIQECKD